MKIKKSIMAVILSFLTAFAAGCDNNATENKGINYFDKIAFWGASNTESIMADEPVRKVSPNIKLSATKGETESGQFIMTSSHENVVSNYLITASELVSEDGKNKIEKENIEIYNQKYIKVSQSSFIKNDNLTTNAYTGYYPDALIPFDRVVKKRENRLENEFNQGIWINVNVPRESVKGKYTGTITVKIGNYTKDVNLELNVYDVTMPTKVNAQSMFSIWYNQIVKGEQISQANLELEESYYDFLAKKRINPTAVPEMGYSNYEEFAEYIVKYAKDERISRYRLPVKLDPVRNGYVANKEDAKALLTALANKQQKLVESGDTVTNLFAKGFWYTIDEPDFVVNGKDTMEFVSLNEIALVKAKEEVALVYPQFASSIKKIANIMVTQNLHTDYSGNDEDGGIQTWFAQIQNFESDKKYTVNGQPDKSAKDFIDWRRTNPDNKAAGEDVWWYNCNVPVNPYPTFMLDDNLISSRLMTWMQYNLGITGSLAWCVNYNQNLGEDRDVWEDPRTVGRINSDGFLMYPGSKYGIDGPIGTIRLESIREGKEDYEYFVLLENRIKELNLKYGKSYNAKLIQETMLKKMVRNNVIPIIDMTNHTEHKTFSTSRDELLTLLQNILQDDEKAKTTLDALS